MPALTRRTTLVSCLISLFVTLGTSAAPAKAGAEPLLVGPAEVDPGQVVTYETSGKCDNDVNKPTVLTISGDRSAGTRSDRNPLSVINPSPTGGFVEVAFDVPEVSETTQVRLELLCPVNGDSVRYRKIVTITGPLLSSGPGNVEANLVFPADLTPMSKARATGDYPCSSGNIVSTQVFVKTGTKKWTNEPVYSASINSSGFPVLNFDSIGRPVFDGVPPTEARIEARIVCTTDRENITYYGEVRVLDDSRPTTTTQRPPAPVSTERGAITVSPSQVTEGGSIVISNGATSPCRKDVRFASFSGAESGDGDLVKVKAVKGSELGDHFVADASGNWSLKLTFADGFLKGLDIRRLTVTMGCASSSSGRTVFDFYYQPAAFSIVAELPTTTVTPPASDATSAPSVTPSDGADEVPPTDDERDQAPDSPGNPAATPSGFGIPTGQTVDAGGNQILPRAYLDGDTQQLIELSTGNVIGEYDPISGQFIDPATGEVTGIVDPATGELIDAATGIQIGQSTRPEGSTDGLSALGLGDDAGTTSDESGSNILAIVLAAAVGALLVAVVALAISRRKKPNLPPPPAV